MKRLTCWALKTPIHLDVHFALGKVYRQAIGVRLIALLLLCKASRALRRSVTTDSSSVVEHLHDRMPVILPECQATRFGIAA